MISIKNLVKEYDGNLVYDNFNLDIKKGEITVVLGESGCGKTTLLNVLSKLTDYQGQVVGDYAPISRVFQDDRLIPNLTVAQNLLLVNPSANVTKELKDIGLEGKENDYPKSLSGGMKRRVAILRALIFPYKTLLLDEPLNSLDLALKLSLIEKIKKSHKENGGTIVMVTHDIKEAVLIADRIIVLQKGKVVYDNSQIEKKTEDELFDLLSKRNNNS